MGQLTYELVGGPLDGESGEVKGRVPEKLYRRGGGVIYSEYAVSHQIGDKLIYKPVEKITES